MKPRARRERFVLRARRQGWASGRGTLRAQRSRYNQMAAGLWPALPPQEAADRLAAVFRHYAIADGMAYIPHDPPPEVPDFWGPGAWVAGSESADTLQAVRSDALQPVPTGLPPINAAYWMDEEADAPRDPVELQERMNQEDWQ